MIYLPCAFGAWNSVVDPRQSLTAVPAVTPTFIEDVGQLFVAVAHSRLPLTAKLTIYQNVYSV
jgi:hypothetical protein